MLSAVTNIRKESEVTNCFAEVLIWNSELGIGNWIRDVEHAVSKRDPVGIGIFAVVDTILHFLIYWKQASAKILTG